MSTEGGTLFAFALDVKIREASQNERSLDTVMANLFREFGNTGKRYEYEDIVRIASEVSGTDQTAFFNEYVAGNEYLDVSLYAESAGLQLDTMADEFYLSDLPESSRLSQAIREGIFGRLP